MQIESKESILKIFLLNSLMTVHITLWAAMPIFFSIAARYFEWPMRIFLGLPAVTLIWGWIIKKIHFQGNYSLMMNFIYFFTIIAILIFSFIIGQVFQLLIFGE
jgi:hypothetical protein